MIKKHRDYILRALKLICLFSFFLPFVGVKSCSSGRPTDFTGTQLIQESSGEVAIIYAIAIGIWIALLGLSFVKIRFNDILKGYLNSGRAVLSLLAGCMVFVLDYQFMFDTLIPRAGIILYCTSALFIYLYGNIKAFKTSNQVKTMSTPEHFSKGVLYAFFKGSQYVLIVLILALWLLFNIEKSGGLSSFSLFDISNTIIFLFAVPIFFMTYFTLKGLDRQYVWAKWHGLFSIVLIFATCLWLIKNYI